MTVILNFFEFELVYAILIILGIIQGSSLVFGGRDLQKDLNELKYLNYLIITGYILTVWYITNFFFPTGISYSLPYTESDNQTVFTITLVLYSILPNSIHIILGGALFYFFYRNNHLYERLLPYASIILVVGYIVSIIISVLMRYFIHFDIYTYIDLEDYFLALNIIILCIHISVVLILILYSVYLNNKYFMIFSCLFLVQLLDSLIPLLQYI
ncbi:MAG: hypothetical protein ACFFA0_02835 [Promethearchaeota archaeon]